MDFECNLKVILCGKTKQKILKIANSKADLKMWALWAWVPQSAYSHWHKMKMDNMSTLLPTVQSTQYVSAILEWWHNLQAEQHPRKAPTKKKVHLWPEITIVIFRLAFMISNNSTKLSWQNKHAPVQYKLPQLIETVWHFTLLQM